MNKPQLNKKIYLVHAVYSNMNMQQEHGVKTKSEGFKRIDEHETIMENYWMSIKGVRL